MEWGPRMQPESNMKRILAWVLAGMVGVSSVAQAQDAPKAEPKADQKEEKPAGAAANQAELEKKFEETMTGAVLVGRFSSKGRQGDPREERYTIVSAKKFLGERWVITAKIQYGGKGETAAIPIVVPVKWAGDTPVISLTDFSIPGMGTYTARVMIFQDQYAGMWAAGTEHGGLMWGRIERAPAEAVKPAENK